MNNRSSRWRRLRSRWVLPRLAINGAAAANADVANADVANVVLHRSRLVFNLHLAVAEVRNFRREQGFHAVPVLSRRVVSRFESAAADPIAEARAIERRHHEHPVVVPQASQTRQVPARRTRNWLQVEQESPV